MPAVKRGRHLEKIHSSFNVIPAWMTKQKLDFNDAY